MSQQEQHRIFPVDDESTITSALAIVLRSSGVDVTPFTQPIFPGELMKSIRAVFALPILAMALASMPAMAQDHQDQDHRDNHTYKQHSEWKTGAKVQQEDWNRGDKVDYKQNHLRRPPTGQEWRQIDGNYVLANQDGKIASVRQAPHDH